MRSNGRMIFLSFAVSSFHAASLSGMYGEDPESVGKTISLAIGAGAIGCNLEDSIASIGELREAGDQASRLRSAREVANAAKIDFFINARCDVFFTGRAEKQNNVLHKKDI